MSAWTDSRNRPSRRSAYSPGGPHSFRSMFIGIGRGKGRTPMTQQPIRFTDGAAYERGMGPWSQLVGEVFLDWLAPQPGLRWIDIGCGNGAFTELLVQRCAPAEMQGI